MIPWQSRHLWPWRRPPLPRKNQVSETGRHTFIVLYCFCCLREFFLCRRLFFTIFLTSKVVAMPALNVWSDHVYWCCYHLASTKKGVPSTPTISVGSAASTLMTTSSSSSIVKSAWQLFLGSPILSTKLPAYRINWLSIDDIRCKLKKYSDEDKTGKKIKEDLSSLLSNFSTSEIRFALVATLAKLELDIKDLPVGKNKLIELFSQLIFDDMSILVNLTKSAKRYV
jgi:hypothetical protein